MVRIPIRREGAASPHVDLIFRIRGTLLRSVADVITIILVNVEDEVIDALHEARWGT